MANDKLLERIERKLGIPGIVKLLAERLSPTDLQSILLEVYRRRAQRQSPADVLSAYEMNRFVKPSAIDVIALLEWEQIAFSQLPPEFEPVVLSPVSPLGSCSGIALVDQNRVLSTVRNTEVVADSTNVLALECAVQRRILLRANPKSKVPVHRAASHRLLRTQDYGDPQLLAHFSAFALCSAGQDAGNFRFELETLRLHMRFYLRALKTYFGTDVPLRLAVTDFHADDRAVLLREQLLSPIQNEYGDVECAFEPERVSGRGYYVDLCFHIYALSPARQWLELADGGVVNWTQRLLNNAKERCVISGIGSERICSEFRRQDSREG